MDTEHTETIDIEATPEEVYHLVAAVDDVARYSPECRRIEWISEQHEPVVGANFRGQNRWRGFHWWREVRITTAERGRVFAFQTVPGRGIYHDTTEWRYDLTPTSTGTHVTESYQFSAPAWLRCMDSVIGRQRALARGMRATLAALKMAAESGRGSPA
jgi:uncharacterized protein YndB with AHSA1/START domain